MTVAPFLFKLKLKMMNIILNHQYDLYIIEQIREHQKKLKISGKIRDISFLKKLAENNRLRFVASDEEIENYFTTLQNLIKALDIIMGDNWDFYLFPIFEKENYAVTQLYEYELAIQLYFPEATVKNENGLEHHITDNIVVFRLLPLNTSMSRLYEFDYHDSSRVTRDDLETYIFNGSQRTPYYVPFSIELTRASLSRQEYLIKYMHSHVSPNNKPFITASWCLGTHYIVDVNEKFLELGHDKQCLNEDNFAVFLLSIQDLLSIESLEGGPHIKMERLFDVEEVSQNFEYINDTYSIYFKDLADKLLDVLFKKSYYYSKEEISQLISCFSITSYGINIIDMISFHNFIKTAIKKSFDALNVENILFSYSPSDNTLVRYVYDTLVTNADIMKKEELSGKTPYTYIRDKKLEFRITSDEVEPSEDDMPLDSFWVEPRILFELKKYLENRINNKYVKYKNG